MARICRIDIADSVRGQICGTVLLVGKFVFSFVQTYAISDKKDRLLREELRP